MGFVRRPDCDLDLRQISACTHNRQTHNTLSRLGCGFDSAGNRHESSTKQWHGQATGGMKEREETRRPRSALRGWLPNTAKVSGGSKAVDKREKRATRRGRVYVASLGPFRYSSGSTALGRWRVRRSAGCLPISASSIYSKHTEVEVEVEVDIAPRSACVLGGGNRV